MSRHICRLEGEKIAITVLKPDQETKDRLIAWLAEDEVAMNTYMAREIWNYANIEDWIQEKGVNRMGIVLKETDELIGFCHIDYKIKELVVEMGLTIGVRELRGRGLGEDAVRAILKYCFEGLDVTHVHVYVLQSNERSIACCKKCGFVISGRCRRWGYFNGPLDWYYMDIIREEYDAVCGVS